MSVLAGLKEAVDKALQLVGLVTTLEGRIAKMNQDIETIKATLAGIGTDVDEIDSDVTALLEKLGSLSGGATAEEVAEVKALAEGIKTRTAGVAAKYTPEQA